ncbi:MAG: ATP-binding protein [Acidimicrobiia bacterium]|nr:ATP-binding protein [Acidimicrobiia bacterium]
MNRASIRLRVTAIAVAAVAGVLSVVSVALVVVQRNQLASSVDAALAQRAEDIASLIETAEQIPIELAGSQQEGFAQLLDSSGRVISSTPNLKGAPSLPIDYEQSAGEVVRTVRGLEVDDDVFRVLSRTVETGLGRAVLHVGTTFDVVAESTGVLTAALAVAIPIVVALVGALVWWLVRRTLEPVEAIRSEVAEIGSSDLHRRVPQPGHDDEIGRLARTMNQMLDRVEASVDRQQRFVADASHELRSPLTRLRTEVEVRLAVTDVEDRAVLEGLLEEVIGLQRLVEDLLHLARADGGQVSLEWELVDLDDVVFREAERLKAEGRILVDVSGVSGAQVRGDARQLTRAIMNLCENAGRHAIGTVTVTLAERDDTAVLTIADDGPGIPSDRVDFVFERFGRLDDSRTQATGGTGLGLAITREIIERHHGTVAIDPDHQTGACFVVTLPLA